MALTPHDAFAVLAAHIAERVTATVPRTTSYRDAIAIAVADTIAAAHADPELARALSRAFAKSLDAA